MIYLNAYLMEKVIIMIDPKLNTGESLQDKWAYDDTMNIRFWVMTYSNDEPFYDDGSEYHVIQMEMAIHQLFLRFTNGLILELK
jgi:hypothetical protein